MAAGSEWDPAEVASKYRPLIYRQAIRLLRHPHDAEDATQEVLMKLYRFLPQFRNQSKLTTWVYRITYNVCMNLFEKRRKAWQELVWVNEDLGVNSEGEIERLGDLLGMLRALYDLPAKYRVPLGLYYILDMPYKQIAERLNLPVNTVKVRIHRGIRLLQRQLGVISDPDCQPDCSTRRWSMSDIMEHVERQFATGIALVTTVGSLGPNVMAAEWTMQVSYDPFLIAVFVSPDEATHGQILESEEFGINICSDDQLALIALAGGYTRREVDKLSSELFETYPAKYIKAPMIKGCVVNAECRLYAHHRLGDHTAFVGEVLAATYDESKRPVIRRGHGFHRLGPQIERPRLVYVAVGSGPAVPGGVIRVIGRAFDPPAEGVRILIEAPTGRQWVLATLETTPRGTFSGDVRLPDDIPSGVPLALVALAGERFGRARLQVVETKAP